MINIPNLNSNVALFIRKELDKKGLAEVSDFIPAHLHAIFVEDILASIDKAQPSSGYKYSLKYDEISNHELTKTINSQPFEDFVNQIVKGLLPSPIKVDQIKVGYSILKGKGNKVPYHFDSINVLNIIFPIILPAHSDEFIDLWTLPNILSFKPSKFNLLLFKVLKNIPVAFRLLRVGVRYRERSLFAFYGSRTYHGVEPADTGELRVIASINIRFKE